VDIGKNVEIGYGCWLGGVRPSHVHIEDNVTIAGASVVLDHDYAYKYTFGGSAVYGDVYVREGSFIGMNSVIYPGVEIGPRAIIGALSFVKSSIPPHCVAAGQPATVRKRVSQSRRADESQVPDIPAHVKTATSARQSDKPKHSGKVTGFVAQR